MGTGYIFFPLSQEVKMQAKTIALAVGFCWFVLSLGFAAKKYPFVPPDSEKKFQEWKTLLKLTPQQETQISLERDKYKTEKKLVTGKRKKAQQKQKELVEKGTAAGNPELDLTIKEIAEHTGKLEQLKMEYNIKIRDLLTTAQQEQLSPKKPEKKERKKKSSGSSKKKKSSDEE